jgi:L-fuconate dehydratase
MRSSNPWGEHPFFGPLKLSWTAVRGGEDRAIEFVDHLHEHFVDPVTIRQGRYIAPQAPGFSARMHDRSIADHLFPDGPVRATPLDAMSA